MKLCFTILTVLTLAVTAFGQPRQIILGSASDNAPWMNTYSGGPVTELRFQAIYSSAEMGGAGTIHTIGLQNGTGIVANTFNNVSIKIWHTTTNVGNVWGTTTAPAGSEMLFATTLTVGSAGANGWEEYQLDTPFDYNGTSNVFIEVFHAGGSGTVPSLGIASGGRAGWSVRYGSGNMSSGNYNWCPNVQFIFGTVNPAPTLTSINPVEGNLFETLNVDFTGNDFIDGETTVSFGSDITVNSVTVSSATNLTANITIDAAAALGARDVSVFNPAPGGGSATLTDGFTVVQPAPVLTGIEPGTGELGGTEFTLIVRGDNYFGDAVVRFDGTDRATENFSDPTILLATITAADLAVAGDYDITVFSSAAGESAPLTFTVANPGAVPEPADFDLVAPADDEIDVPVSGAGFDWEDAE